MSADTIQNRLAAGEGPTTEFKSNVRSIATIGPTVCAFLNGQGGQIYCGIGENGQIVGIKGDAAGLALRVERELRDLISPTSLFSTEVVTVDGRAIIVIEVPQGLDRPYVFKGAVFLRRGEMTVPADASSLKALVREQADAPLRWERRLSSISVSDLDPDEIRTTVRKVETIGRFSLTDRDDDLAVLSDFSVYLNGAITHAGDVLFSKKPLLRHPQRLQRGGVRGHRHFATTKEDRAFEGPLVRVYTELLNTLRAAIPVQSVFLPGEQRRVDQPAYDLRAVGEGIVNAFVHRDYSAYSGGVRVQMFENRIEIWNSGRLPDGLSPGDLRRDHASILVNPDIANVFAALGEMERVGRGTERIVDASQALGARPPLWRDEPSGVTLIIFRAVQSETGVTLTLNERQNRLLLDLQPGDSFTPKEYQARYAPDLNPRSARRDLEELEALKWLVREGATRSTKYRLS
jgi:ATP-dependent DNA helicase RecG